MELWDGFCVTLVSDHWFGAPIRAFDPGLAWKVPAADGKIGGCRRRRELRSSHWRINSLRLARERLPL
jgi:hypothetical protein